MLCTLKIPYLLIYLTQLSVAVEAKAGAVKKAHSDPAAAAFNNEAEASSGALAAPAAGATMLPLNNIDESFTTAATAISFTTSSGSESSIAVVNSWQIKKPLMNASVGFRNEADEVGEEEVNGKPAWMFEALRDIAYYLRAHKFNEYDRRYETDSSSAKREYYKHFPSPPLRSLHWEVRKYCEELFTACVKYLAKKIQQTALRRSDDTSVIMQEQRWNLSVDAEKIKLVEDECRKLLKIDDVRADPFAGPLERYQWRVTASYYMCWYTMQEQRELEHLSEPACDNFAACLDAIVGPKNGDVRADDGQAFSCAMYSFCPDPCCPKRHLTTWQHCWDSHDNPCFESNPLPVAVEEAAAATAGQHRRCAVNRSLNIEFRDIILNRWNVTCNCPKLGYEWNSLYGICIDRDECAITSHNCNADLEDCVNLPGSYRCVCKWGHVWNADTGSCQISPQLTHLKKLLRKGQEDDMQGNKVRKFRLRNLFKYVFGSAPDPHPPNSYLVLLNVVVTEIVLLIIIY